MKNVWRQLKASLQKGLRLVAALSLASLIMTGSAAANGWEHGAIPFEALVEALEHPSAAIRAQASNSLGFRGEERAVEYLINLLDRPEPDAEVRSAAYLALGEIGSAGAVPVLGRCLREEERDDLRADCLTAMGDIGSPLVLGNVLDATAEQESILVRSAAVDALGGYESESAWDRLIEIAADQGNLSLSNRAIKSLGEAAAVPAIPTLLTLLADSEDPTRQRFIIRALGDLGAEDAVAALEELAADSADHEVRIEATFALGTIRDGSAIPTLLASLNDPHPAVIYTALRTLLGFGDPRAASPIADLARTIHERVAAHSADELYTDFVVVYADMSVLVEALRVLSELDAIAGTDVLLAAAENTPLDDVDAMVRLRLAEAVYERRRIALYGLGYTSSDEARVLLSGSDGISDPDPRLRATAVRSLGVLGGTAATETVIPLLADESRDVRIMTARVLGLLGDTVSAAPLLELLEDPMSGVRLEAARSLGYLRARMAEARLALLAESDPDVQVREAATYALDLIRSGQ